MADRIRLKPIAGHPITEAAHGVVKFYRGWACRRLRTRSTLWGNNREKRLKLERGEDENPGQEDQRSHRRFCLESTRFRRDDDRAWC